MKIVEIIPAFFPLGGAERLVFDLAKTFAKSKEHEVDVISLYTVHPEDVRQAFAKYPNISIHFLGKRRGIDLTCAEKLRKLLDEIQPDVIHCHLDSLLTVYLSRRAKKYPVYYTFHTLITEQVIGKKNKPKNLLYRHVFRKGLIRPITIAKTIQEAVSSYYDLPLESIPLVKNGVPLQRYFNETPFLKRKYDFIYIGRFIEIKNPQTIVLAMKEVLQKHPLAKLLMLGEGELLEECKQTAGTYLGKEIEFLGFVDDVSPYLKNAKTLLLPSTYEGNPMVINEAIASNCFVLATSVGGIPDIVNDNNGALMRYGENLCPTLTKSMMWCLENETLIEKRLSANYEVNRKEVSIEATANGYLTLFQEKHK